MIRAFPSSESLLTWFAPCSEYMGSTHSPSSFLLLLFLGSPHATPWAVPWRRATPPSRIPGAGRDLPPGRGCALGAPPRRGDGSPRGWAAGERDPPSRPLSLLPPPFLLDVLPRPPRTPRPGPLFFAVLMSLFLSLSICLSVSCPSAPSGSVALPSFPDGSPRFPRPSVCPSGSFRVCLGGSGRRPGPVALCYQGPS